MSRARQDPRREIGRLAAWRLLGSVVATVGLLSIVIWGYVVGDDRHTRTAVIVLGVALTAYAARMLLYLAAIIFRGGCALYEQNGRIVLLFPFYQAIRLEQITEISFGEDYFVVGWPRWVRIRGWGDQVILAHSFYFSTGFREMAARLRDLGLPVADDPRLQSDPFAPEPRPAKTSGSIPRGNHAGVLDHEDGGAA